MASPHEMTYEPAALISHNGGMTVSTSEEGSEPEAEQAFVLNLFVLDSFTWYYAAGVASQATPNVNKEDYLDFLGAVRGCYQNAGYYGLYASN
eukprot:scaffold4917_cov120-Cylindrotheca_fusiformis.AAC.4